MLGVVDADAVGTNRHGQLTPIAAELLRARRLKPIRTVNHIWSTDMSITGPSPDDRSETGPLLVLDRAMGHDALPSSGGAGTAVGSSARRCRSFNAHENRRTSSLSSKSRRVEKSPRHRHERTGTTAGECRGKHQACSASPIDLPVMTNQRVNRRADQHPCDGSHDD